MLICNHKWITLFHSLIFNLKMHAVKFHNIQVHLKIISVSCSNIFKAVECSMFGCLENVMVFKKGKIIYNNIVKTNIHVTYVDNKNGCCIIIIKEIAQQLQRCSKECVYRWSPESQWMGKMSAVGQSLDDFPWIIITSFLLCLSAVKSGTLWLVLSVTENKATARKIRTS